MSEFALNEKLEADTWLICDLPLSRMLLMNDSRYPWIILVPRVEGLTEIHQLAEDDQRQLLKESNRVSKFILESFPVFKMNVGVLGNIVSQLHVHHIGRNEKDPAWPGPVWGHSPAVAYTDDEARQVVKLLKYEFT